jgi:hypothetical protein
VKSAEGSGPKLYFQNKEYRIEGFFEGRPITIWEMRNPMLYLKYAEMMVDYNFSSAAQSRIMEIHPLDKNNLFIHTVLKDWGPKLQKNMPLLKKNLEDAGD